MEACTGEVGEAERSPQHEVAAVQADCDGRNDQGSDSGGGRRDDGAGGGRGSGGGQRERCFGVHRGGGGVRITAAAAEDLDDAN